jgi:4-aminobutyrate aminotransferase / (S)-3-amino-2-methylpropionate transaminase / 5-aminovalerate transaminase
MGNITLTAPAAKTISFKTPFPGPKTRAILQRRIAALPAGSARATDVVVASARGAVVTDVDGNTFLDFAGGIGMLNVGSSPQNVVDAVKKQMDLFIHSCLIVSTNEPAIELAEMLHKLTPGTFQKKTLFGNSGAEAVENAVNVAKYYTQRPAVIVFEGAYHGRTHLTMSLTSKYNLFKKGYGSMVSDIYRLPAPNMYRIPEGFTADQYLNYLISNLEHALTAQVDPSAVAAILIEPVQGEAGFVPMPKPFLQKLREIADKHGIVLIFDEIQCGMGRTGKVFACEHMGVIPDMITTAKSLGAGFPISAVIGRADIMDAPHLGGVGGTYGGSPVACVAAIEALKTISSPAFLERTRQIGDKIVQMATVWQKKYACVGDVRGLGAMNLIEFVKDKKSKTPDADFTLEVIKEAVAHGVMVIRAGLYSNCIRLLPPLVITDAQLEEGMAVLEAAIAKIQQKRNA